MIVLSVDFNARTENDLVRLDATGARRSIAQGDVMIGELAIVSDGEVRASGVVVAYGAGLAVQVDWETVHDEPVKTYAGGPT